MGEGAVRKRKKRRRREWSVEHLIVLSRCSETKTKTKKEEGKIGILRCHLNDPYCFKCGQVSAFISF